jgi:hypothetical protein
LPQSCPRAAEVKLFSFEQDGPKKEFCEENLQIEILIRPSLLLSTFPSSRFGLIASEERTCFTVMLFTNLQLHDGAAVAGPLPGQGFAQLLHLHKVHISLWKSSIILYTYYVKIS